MPYPCCDAGVAVNAAMFTAISQKETECGKAHQVVDIVAMCDPRLVFFGKEAGAMEDADPNVNDVVIGDGIFGEIREGGAAK